MRVKSWALWSFSSWPSSTSGLAEAPAGNTGFCVSSHTFLHHFQPDFLMFLLPLLAFYGILRAAAWDCITAKVVGSSALRRTRDGGWRSKAATWPWVPKQSLSVTVPVLVSLWLLWLPSIPRTASRTVFPHYFVACPFFPGKLPVCLSTHLRQREYSPVQRDPFEIISFSMEKALQTRLVVNARHVQEQHFSLLLHQAFVKNLIPGACL